MKPYPAYRPTGLPWLPQIPAHWEQRRAKNIFTESSKIVGRDAKNYPLLSLTLRGVIHRDIDSGKGKFPASFDTYKVVEKGNMVFCLFDVEETPRTVGLSEYEGMITGAYTIFQVHGVNARFIYYYYLALDNVKALQPLYSGLRKTIPIERLLGMRLPVPPREEQDRIVRFLDAKVAQIDQLIAVKKRQIELMEERKSAIIDSELTSSSGDWETKPLKWYVTNNDESLSETTPDDYSFEYIDIGSVGFRQLKTLPERLVFASAPSRARKIVREGDTILSTVRTYLKAILYIDAQLAGKIVSTGFAVLRPKVGVYPQLLSYALSGSAFIESVIRKSVGVSYPAINDTKLLAIKVRFPQTIEAQKALHTRILRLTQSTNEAIDRAARMIRCLQELKARLISDVVTGAVDVRGKEA